MLIFHGNAISIVVSVNDQNPAQEMPRHASVFGCCADKRVRGSDHPRFFQRRRCAKARRAADIRKRKERRAACLFSFKQRDHLLARRIVRGDNILNAAAERGLDRGFIGRVCFDQIRDNADNPAVSVPALHHAADRVAKAFIALGQVQKSIQSGFCLMVLRFFRTKFLVGAGKLCLFLRNRFFGLFFFLRKIRVFSRRLLKRLLQIRKSSVVLGLLAADGNKLRGKRGLPQFQLLLSFRKSRHPGLDLRPGIQKVQNLIPLLFDFI